MIVTLNRSKEVEAVKLQRCRAAEALEKHLDVMASQIASVEQMEEALE